MGIRVRPGAAEAIVSSPQRFALQIEGADDVGGALAALRLLRVELVGLSGQGRRPAGHNGRDGGPVSHADVSPAVAGPGGPLVLVQHLDAKPAELDRIPDLVATRLAEAGVSDATIAVPELGGRLDTLAQATGAVVLRLFPGPGAPGGAIPPRWLDVAVDWIVADLDLTAVEPGTTVAARVLAVEHEVAAGAVADLLHDCGVARAWCDLVTGDPADRIRSASATYGRLPHLSLAAGGPGVDRPGLVARFELLRDLARELTDDLGYACLDFEPDFGGIGAGLPATGWQAQGGASPNRLAAVALHELVPDAYPWQVLTAAQAARLATSGEVPAWQPLGGGHVEIALGDPVAWLPRSTTRDEAQAVAIDWLAPLLVDGAELEGLTEASAAPPSSGGPTAGGVTDATPDLESVVLRPTSSLRRSTRLTVLELAAWFAHEPHSDAPAAVSPVLASFVRIWAAGLDEATRQRLKPIAPRLVGTGGDTADDGRRWALLDWLIRVQARGWLEAAGESQPAGELARLGFTGDRGELGRAVEVLAGYLTGPTGRTGAPTADDDRSAWEAWESVREPAGWVAASEASTQGGPREVADAADLQVIEVTRGSPAQPEGAAERLVEDAWQAALRAAGSDTWEQAWRAADQVARERSGLTIRIEMGRVAKAMPSRQADEHLNAELEVAERAALESLIEAMVLPVGDVTHDDDARIHPWDAAVDAARGSRGGPSWSLVLDGSRDAVGEGIWLEAIAQARSVVDARLAGGADTAALAVAVAIARESSSRAARRVAERAGEAARAGGAGDDEVAKTARGALDEVAAGLVEAAFDLLDGLVQPAP